ncbi:MAG: ABC transporter permease [Succinivibrio sp.]
MSRTVLLSLQRILSLIKKEFLIILMDKKSRVVLFVPVIVQCIIFGYGASYHLQSVPYAIMNRSSGKLAFEFENELLNTPVFTLIKKCANDSCLKDCIETSKCLLSINIRDDFDDSREIFIGTDARNTASANTAAGYLSEITQSLNRRFSGKRGISINSRFLFNENNYTRYTILVGMCLALSVIQVLLLSALSVCREKEDGTYDMMLMTPSRPFELLIGKATAPICIAAVQSLIMILICVFYFSIPMRGSIISIMMLIFTFSATVVGIGLAVSTVAKTTQQALITGFILCLILIMTSGLITAVDGMPAYFKVVAAINPVHYGINAIWQIFLQGKGYFEVLGLILPLIGTGIVTLSVAAWLFRHRIDN